MHVGVDSSPTTMWIVSFVVLELEDRILELRRDDSLWVPLVLFQLDTLIHCLVVLMSPL